jgi:DNA-binding beta-propeller fold protein YncE
VTPGPTIPWTVTTVTIGAAPTGILFDGTAMWVTDYTNGNLLKLDGNATVLQTIPVGAGAAFLASDGANLWVPLNGGAATAVVRASTGVILATLTGNGQVFPNTAAFDGERILVTNANGDSVSLWKAADLSPIGSVPTGDSTYPAGACSDGINFWITFVSSGQLARF